MYLETRESPFIYWSEKETINLQDSLDRTDLYRQTWIGSFSLNPSEQEYDRVRSFLSIEELEKFSRFQKETLKKRAILSRAFTRNVLGKSLGINPKEIKFSYNKNEKPFISYPKTNLSFNLSHSRDLWVIALSRKRKVGIDIEFIEKEFEYREITRHHFSEHEQNFIESHGDGINRVKAFYQVWSTKEAFTKAVGCGLSIPLTDIQFEPHSKTVHKTNPRKTESEALPSNWLFEHFHPAPTFYGCAVVEQAESSVPTKTLDLRS